VRASQTPPEAFMGMLQGRNFATESLVALVARNDPNEQEYVVPYHI
jgi:uncharacterized RmlC-like cupin family protein